MIQEAFVADSVLGNGTYVELFKGKMLSRTMVGILVQMFQQMTCE